MNKVCDAEEEKLRTISPPRNWRESRRNETNLLDSTGRKGAITDLGEFSRKDDSWNHLERPRLPASIIFVRVRLCESGSSPLDREREIHGKLKQGYNFKWLLLPFLIGVKAVGAGGC